MYPLNAPAPWPSNQWYVAGFAEEVGRSILARPFLGKRVVLFRDESGAAHALSGVCPHRMMPLERGTLEGDRLVCGYHGLTFDTSGACVAAPTSPSLPACALPRFPLREVGPLLWIWLGDPALADNATLPAQHAIGIGVEGWLTQLVDHVRLEARYLLLVDNLFDLSHLGFIHASILGAGGIALAEPVIEERDGRLVVSRMLADAPTDDYHRFLHPGIGPRMTTTIASDLLGVSLINAGGPAFDGASADAPLLGHQNFIHAITPETEHSTHYWILMTRDFRQDDEALGAALAAQNKAVVAQDREALEDIERLLGSGVELPREISMKPDAGALRARLRIMQMIRAEQETGVQSAA
jgi:vanillate O-demethylase monooxygenase subunit